MKNFLFSTVPIKCYKVAISVFTKKNVKKNNFKAQKLKALLSLV